MTIQNVSQKYTFENIQSGLSVLEKSFLTRRQRDNKREAAEKQKSEQKNSEDKKYEVK